MDDLFNQHLSAVLNIWPDVLDINAIGLADGDYDLKLRRSIALNNFYDDEIEEQAYQLGSYIQWQLSWLVHCELADLAKNYLNVVRVREIRPELLKQRLDAMLLKSALPQLTGAKESHSPFDLGEVKDYLVFYGLVTPDLKPTNLE